MSHSHVWRELWRDAWAFYSKRSDGQTNDVFWATGDVDGCTSCDSLRIRPHTKGLDAVEVIVVKERSAQKEAA